MNLLVDFSHLLKTWDEELYDDAVQWSNMCAGYSNQVLERRVGKWNSVGQNVKVVSEIADAVALWEREGDYYNHTWNTCQDGHFCDNYKQLKLSLYAFAFTGSEYFCILSF
ncbi:unnamed protein product [Heterobilharzia americana]|nr:unnamed protein product [Heterobilharzia americana]